MSVVDLFNQIAKNDFGFFQQVHSVSDVMNSEPCCLTLDHTFEQAWEQFERCGTCHAAVVNPEDQSIVGVISDRDLLRHRPRYMGTAAEGDNDHKALRNGVTKFMTRNPIWCTKDTSPVDVMSLMLNHHIDSVLVSPDGRTLEGIVTPRDFVHTLLLYHRVCTRDFSLKRLRLVDLDLCNGLPLDEIFSRGAQTVRDVMSKSVHTLNRDDLVSTAIKRMQDLEVRHLPVLNSEQQLAGIVSDREILRCLPTPQQRSEEPQQRFRESLFSSDDKSVLHERVESIMTKKDNMVHADMLLTDAMTVFQNSSLSGLPVIYADTGKLCGIITTSDILKVFRVVMQIGSLADSSEDNSQRNDAT